MKQTFLKFWSWISLPALWLLLIFFSACSDNSTLVKVPSNANWVVYADFKKLAIQAFSLSDLISKAKQSDAPQQNPKDQKDEVSWDNVGLDLLSKAVMFQKSTKEDEKIIFILIPLSDRADFITFCEKKGKFKAAASMGENWYSNHKITFFASEKMAIGIADADRFEKNKIQEEVNGVLNLTEENNLLKKSDEFDKLVAEEKSLAFWANTSTLLDETQGFFSADFLRGELTGSLDFRTGELVAESRIMPENSEKTQSIFGKELSKELLTECTKGKKSSALFALSLSLSEMFKMAEKAGANQTGDLMLAAYGISLEDLKSQLSGEIAIAMNSAESGAGKMPEFRFLLGTKNGPEGLLAKLQNGGSISAGPDGNYRIRELTGYRITKSGKSLVIEPENYRTGSETADESLSDFLMKDPMLMAGSIDFDQAGAALPMNQKKQQMDSFTKKWTKMFFRMQNSGNSSTAFSMTLKCRNEDQSSLLALLESLKEVDGKNNQNEIPETESLPADESDMNL